MSDRGTPVPPTPPPVTPGSRRVSDASQSTPTRSVSLRRVSLDTDEDEDDWNSSMQLPAAGNLQRAGTTSILGSSYHSIPLTPQSPSFPPTPTTPTTPATNRRTPVTAQSTPNVRVATASARPTQGQRRAPPQIVKRKSKVQLNANYSILISGTESDSEASSIDANAIQRVEELNEMETAVFDAVSAGSLVTAREGLSAFRFDYNRRNIVGYTILHIAIRRQDEEMVKLIIAEGEDIWPSVLKDALLHAIRELNAGLVRTVLDELDRKNIPIDEVGSTRNLRKDYVENRNSIDEQNEFINSEFHEDVTPLKLSAICDSYELVYLFHERGHVLREPEVYVPRAGTRANITNDIGPLRAAYRRLHFYQAISKPAYLAYKANHCNENRGESTCDPILIAFTLIKEMNRFANDDVFKKEYLEIASELEDFTCNIIQQCRRTEETEEILEQAEGYFEASPYPRLSMAMDLGLKSFSTHRHCQQIMYRYWAGKYWPEWRLKGGIALFGQLLLRIFIWPLIVLWTCVDRKSSYGRLVSCPASSFLNHVVSYLYFVSFIIIIEVYNPDGPNHRGLPRTGVEYAVIAWVAGFWLSIVKQLVSRTYSYLSNTWAFVEIVTNFLFVAAFALWFASGGHPALNRKYWRSNDLSLIADVLFAAASIMACLRLLIILSLNTRLGPLVVAFGYMFFDVMKMCVFFSVVVCAFALSLSRLYMPYRGWTDIDPVTKEQVTQSEGFHSFTKAAENLFWSIFAMGDATFPVIIPRTVVSVRDAKLNGTVHMYFVETTGRLIYEAYHIIMYVIMLNMLLGMVSRTYGEVAQNVEVEWKFARTKIWLSFGLDFVNPPPFNFIPPLAACLNRKPNSNPREKKQHYYKLIKVLIQRYFRGKAEIASLETATVKCIEDLSEDIAEFQSLLEQTESEQFQRQTMPRIVPQEPQRFVPKRALLPSPQSDDFHTPTGPSPPGPSLGLRGAANSARRFRRPRLPPQPPGMSPTTPNVSSIFGDTSDDTDEFETVASYERRLSNTNVQSPTPTPPPGPRTPAPARPGPTPPPVPSQGRPGPASLPLLSPARPGPAPPPVTTPARPGPASLPVTTPARPGPAPLPVTTPGRPGPAPLPVTTPARPGPAPLPVTTPARSGPALLPGPSPARPGPAPLPVPSPARPGPAPPPVPSPARPGPGPLPVPSPARPGPAPLPVRSQGRPGPATLPVPSPARPGPAPPPIPPTLPSPGPAPGLPQRPMTSPARPGPGPVSPTPPPMPPASPASSAPPRIPPSPATPGSAPTTTPPPPSDPPRDPRNVRFPPSSGGTPSP